MSPVGTAQPLKPPLYYREAYFSFYYQIQALTNKALPGGAVRSSGYSAALCGVLSFIALAVYLRRLANLGPWWSLFLFLNTPALVLNFLYGNEASLSMALLAAAVAMISLRRGLVPDAASGVILGFAFWCRPDIVLMAPFILLLLATNGELLTFDWKRISLVASAATATIILYWLLFVRAFPTETAFPWIIDWRIFAVYLLFGFGPVVMFLAVLGFLRVNKQRWLLPLGAFAPLAYYFRDLGSPKYILGLAFGITLCAAWALASAGRTLKIVALCVSLIFWFVSITPFGIFGPTRGGHWVAPAGHGPVAFGAYLPFYKHIRDGFFGVRYEALQKTWELVLQQYVALLRAPLTRFTYCYSVLSGASWFFAAGALLWSTAYLASAQTGPLSKRFADTSPVRRKGQHLME